MPRIHHLASVLLLSCGLATVAQAQAPAQPVGVIVAPVKREPFTDRVEALGTLRANETVNLAVKVTETVRAVHFEDGQRVQKGDVLVEMTNAQETADLNAAMAAAQEARQQFNRASTLAKQGNAPKSLLDQRRREYETARAVQEGIQSRMQDRLLIAPFDGVLGLRNISVGALVSPGTFITTIDDDRVMKLDFSVPSTFIEVLKPGLQIEARAAGMNDHVFKGTVSAVDSQIDAVTRSIKVRALIDNDERLLKPGLLMSVELLKHPRDTLVIPEEALVPEAERTYVFLPQPKDDGLVAERRQITIGSRRPGDVEVVEGLTEGESVITHGAMKLRVGAPVTIRAEDDGTADMQEILKPQDQQAEQAE